MPELPEVETIIRQLNKTIKGEVIKALWTDSPNNLRGDFKLARVRSLIRNQKILKAERRGKNILIFLSKNWVWWIHLKLTGHLLTGFYNYKNSHWQPQTKS